MSLCRWSACRPITLHYTHGHVGPCQHTREHKRDRHWISVYESCAGGWLVVPLHDMTLHYITHTYGCQTGVNGVYVCVCVCVCISVPITGTDTPQPCEHPSTAKNDRQEGQFMRKVKLNARDLALNLRHTDSRARVSTSESLCAVN